MLSSCPELVGRRQRHIPITAALLLSGTVAVAVPCEAAQVYVQPVATLSAQYDSNVDLDPVSQQGNFSYVGDASTLIGIASPDSDFNIKPRLRYADYPNESGLDRLEAMLDLNSGYTTPRAKFRIFGRFDHLNDNEAEDPSAIYNDVNPLASSVTQTGQVNLKVTRNNVWTEPSFTWKLSPLLNVGVTGIYQSQNFSPSDDFAHVDFDYYEGAATFGGNLSRRTDFELEAYAGRYQARKITSTANSTGGSAGLNFSWSAIASGGVSVQYQHSQIDALLPTRFVGPANTWGATANAKWRLQTSQFRIDIGRVITPSSGGTLYVAEQAQAEYDRDLTERLTFTGALLYVHSVSLAGVGAGFDTNYHRADISLKWMLSSRWFLQGGYGYVWDKYSPYASGALDNLAYVRFGYQGLPRQY